MTDTVNEEDKAREVSRAGQARFLPAIDSFRPVRDVPDGFGLTGSGDLAKEYVSVDEREVGKAGGTAAYMETHHPSDLAECNDENISELEQMWKTVFGVDCPYDFDDPHDRDINYQVAVDELEGSRILNLSRKKMGVDVLKTEGVDVEFDLSAKAGEYIIQGLEDLRPVDFFEDIWRNCRVITLKRPYDENSDWVIILQAWKDKGVNNNVGEWKRFALKLPDLERSLVIDEDRRVKLPGLESGDAVERARFKMALGKIKVAGSTIAGAALFIEDWPKR